MAPNQSSDTAVVNAPCGYTPKLRKVTVEKLRRDRINSSIERLRTILHRGQRCKDKSSAKLEKADILEMAVGFLRERTHGSGVPPCHSTSQGFSRCLRETLRHLSPHVPLRPAERGEVKPSSSPRSQGSLWRPW